MNKILKGTMNDLKHNEDVIERSINSWIDLGNAFREIRENSLFTLLGYSNFDEYLKKRWDKSPSWGYHLVSSVAAADTARQIAGMELNERQAREISRMKSEDDRVAVIEVISEVPEEDRTSLAIRALVRAKMKTPRGTEGDVILAQVKTPYMKSLAAIKVLNHDMYELSKTPEGYYLKLIVTRLREISGELAAIIKNTMPNRLCRECKGARCQKCRGTGFITTLAARRER